jgi:hemerythrin-like domain-containing protein
MNTLDSYRDSHAELRQMVDDLQSLMTPERLRISPNAQIAYQMLCNLGQRVKCHLAEEDKELYPSLLIHDDPLTKSVAWGSILSEKPLRKRFEAYHKKWLKNCDFDFTDEFLAETYEFLEMIYQRIDHEEHVLLPKALEIGAIQGAYASPRSAGFGMR